MENQAASDTNQVFMGIDRILNNVYVGPQTREDVAAVASTNQANVAQIRGIGNPVRIIVDLSRLDRLPGWLRSGVVDGFRGLDFDRAAIYGLTPWQQLAARLRLSRGNLGYFDNEAHAREFLRQGLS